MRKKFSLVGVDGNAFSVMAYVKTAMREAGFSKKERSEYVEDCMRGDYDRLLIFSEEMIERCNDALGLDYILRIVFRTVSGLVSLLACMIFM